MYFRNTLVHRPTRRGAYANGKVTEFEYAKKLGEKFLYNALIPSGSGNHFAKCGRLSVFRRHADAAIFFHLPL